jgi:penicillin amidase
MAVGFVSVFLDELRDEIFTDELGTRASSIGRLTTDQVWFDRSDQWIDDITTSDTVETRLEIGRRALRRTLELCDRRRWGDMQTMTMQHPMAAVPIVGSLLGLGRGPWPHGGSPGTLNAAYHRRTGPASYSAIVGPSWRFVLDFADVDAATMVLPAGNSGNPMSPHFFDFNEKWRRGEYWTVPITHDRVFEEAVSVLTLTPVTPDADRSH